MADDWITTLEAASLSNYHPEHIRRLIRSGHIVGKKWAQTWMISRKSLLEYLNKEKRRGPKPREIDSNKIQ